MAEPYIPAIDFLHTVSTRIAAKDPLHEVLDQIVSFVTGFMSCDSCFLYVLEGDELILRASKNDHPEVMDRLKIPVGQGITGWVAQNKQPVALAQNAWKDPRFRGFAELPEDSFHAFLSVPVISGGRLISVLNVQHREPYQFSPGEVKMLSTIGHLVGTEIERVRLEQEVSALSEKLATRKLVERAKGIMQRDVGMSEEQAYIAIQTEARQRRKTMKQIAEAILLSDELRRGSAVVARTRGA